MTSEREPDATTESGTWVRACSVDELAPGEARLLGVEPPVALFNVEGSYWATADTCTHDKSSLSDGYIDGDEVECAWHLAKFCIRTGAVLSLPATVSLTTYPTKVDAGDVYVRVGG